MSIGDQGQGNVEFGLKPPLPELTLRVGVTGHRLKPAKLPSESHAFVKDRMREIFAEVNKAIDSVFTSQRKCFSGERPVVRLVSGLAEGADQFAVEVMPACWHLDAVLPFPNVMYEKDFSSEPGADGKSPLERYRDCLKRPDGKVTVTELPSEKRTRRTAEQDGHDPGWQESDPGYARLGAFLLRQVDILVAVWDGKPEAGRGGTADVVRAATRAAIPVAWVHSLQNTPPRLVDLVDSEGYGVASDADCCGGPLRKAIEVVVGFPTTSEPTGDGSKTAIKAGLWSFLLRSGKPKAMHGSKIPERLRDYLQESRPKSFFSIYDAFKRIANFKWPRRVYARDADGHRAVWTLALPEDTPDGLLGDRLKSVLQRRYEWADALAVAYSHRYRSAYFFCYFLAVAAVAIALCGMFLDHNKDILRNKAFLVDLELFVVGLIIGVVYLGRRWRWKEKWMEYRSLAELLLNTRFPSYLGENGGIQRNNKPETSLDAWVVWYVSATVREIGLPNTVLSADYQRAVLDALDAQVVLHQQKWHHDNALSLQRIHLLLHGIGVFCFLLILFLLTSYLVIFVWVRAQGYDESWLKEHIYYLTFAAAFLPALGAAVASIRTTGDFEKIAERSEKTSKSLEAVAADIKAVRANPTLDQTADVLLRTTLVLAEDLASWHLVYGDKRLELS